MKAVLVILMAICLGVTGCTASRFYSPGDGQAVAAGEIHVGDRARIVLKSGESRTLRIRAVDSQTLTGDVGTGTNTSSMQVALTDIQTIEIIRTKGLRTAGLVLGVIVGVAVVVVGGILVANCGIKLDNCGD
jgi:hypothetical protein